MGPPSSLDNEETYNDVLGPNGINSRNEKGSNAICFFQSLGLKVMNTFYQHNNYCTWRNPANNSQHMLNIWTTNKQQKIRDQDCRVWNDEGILGSDHSAIIIEVSLAISKILRATL